VVAQDLGLQGLVNHRVSSEARAITVDNTCARWTGGSRGVRTGCTHHHSSGNGSCPRCDHSRYPRHCPVMSMSLGVQQASPPRRNRDALLFVGGRGIGADARHCSSGRGGWLDSAHRPVAVRPGEPVVHNPWRNRHGPGHSDDTGSPGNGNGHSDKAVRSDSSASFADERWMKQGVR